MRTKISAVDRVHADRDPAQGRHGPEGLGHLASRCPLVVMARSSGSPALDWCGAQQAGPADGTMPLRRRGSPPVRRTFWIPGTDEDPDHPQVLFHGQLSKLSAVGAGAAIDALVVAAVGDGDTQVGNGPAEFIPSMEPYGQGYEHGRGTGIVPITELRRAC